MSINNKKDYYNHYLYDNMREYQLKLEKEKMEKELKLIEDRIALKKIEDDLKHQEEFKKQNREFNMYNNERNINYALLKNEKTAFEKKNHINGYLEMCENLNKKQYQNEENYKDVIININNFYYLQLN